jgi:hypothetical protein
MFASIVDGRGSVPFRRLSSHHSAGKFLSFTGDIIQSVKMNSRFHRQRNGEIRQTSPLKPSKFPSFHRNDILGRTNHVHSFDMTRTAKRNKKLEETEIKVIS